MICDQKMVTASNKQQIAKTKRKRARKDVDKDRLSSNLLSSSNNNNNNNEQDSTNTSINNRNMKKIKLEDSSNSNNQIKPSTSTASNFTTTLSTVKEERITATTTLNSNNNKKEEKIGNKGRVNYKITKEKAILSDIHQQQQNQFKFDSSKLDHLNKSSLINQEEKIDEETSDDEDDESFYGDYESADLIGATTSDDQLNKW